MFPRVAKALNNNENYRTDTEYEDNLVSKIFVFMLFNNYSYLTYLAFVKPFTRVRCVHDDCYAEITDTLLILYVVPVIIYAITEVLLLKVRSKGYLFLALMFRLVGSSQEVQGRDIRVGAW